MSQRTVRFESGLPAQTRPAFTTKRTNKGAIWKRRIIGVDGEGWDVDEYGRQCYKLLVAASNDGFESHLSCGDGQRLRTEDMLKWLFELPDGFLTGYSFGYDISMILLDLPMPRLELVRHRDRRPALASRPDKNENYVHYRGWWIDWLPGKRFVIRRGYKSRVIWDAYPWYQAPFVEAVGKSGIATHEELDVVIAGKKRRGDDESHDLDTELTYALMECRLLARMQAKLFAAHEQAGLRLTVFDGPGSSAARALNTHNVRDALGELPPEVEAAAQRSYVGGRFEQTFHGRFPRLYEYDIVSAYPSACRFLPCLAHGEWVHEYRRDASACLIHARWDVDSKATGLWGPFPVRKDDMPIWPFQGHAWVWEEEFKAAQWMGADSFTVLEAWSFVPSCDHGPFAFVQDYFKRRAELKAAGDFLEKVYKLILNSIYGKLCQRVGTRPFQSWVWASMITAHCRAQLLKAMSHDPWGVVMLTTDALYSQRELPLTIGKQLGQWEAGVIDDVLLVQPGFFISEGKSRARGIPDRLVDWEAFDHVWDAVPDLVEQRDFDVSKWGVTLDLPRFIGLKQAVHRGDPLAMGRWEVEQARFAFYSRKRPWQSWTGTHLVSYPPDTPMAGFALTKYDASLWSGERETEFVVENPDSDEWSYAD